MKTLSVIAALVLFVACSDSEETLTSFPSSAGSEWNYRTVYTITYLDSDRVDTVSIIYSAMLSSILNRLGAYNNVIQMDIYWIEYNPLHGTYTGHTTVWYALTGHALTEIAYHNVGSPIVYPKAIAGNIRLRALADMSPWWTMSPALPSADTLYREREALRFPLSEGTSWVSFTDPWTQTCDVKSVQNVNVPAGTFRSFKIEHQNHLESEVFTFFSYFNEIGLVKRTIRFDSLEVTTPEHPEGTGEYFTANELTELVSYTIHD